MRSTCARKIRILGSAVAAILAAFLAASCGNGRSASDSPGSTGDRVDAFDWKREEGAAIRVLVNDHPWVAYAARRLAEFTDLTGISVEFEIYPEDQFRVKRTVEMLSGITDLDVFMIMPGNSMSEYYAREWVEPLDRLIEDASLTPDDLDLADFYPSALDAGIRYGKHFSLPLLLETSILAYNKKIFAEFGLRPPMTMEELETAARTIHQGTEGRIAGITMRGQGSAATSQWADFLHSFGGSWLNQEGIAAIDSSHSIAALRLYGKLLREYGPRDATRYGWYESVNLFARGGAGMIYDGNVFRAQYENGPQGLPGEQVGYAMLPAGPSGTVPHISNWGLSIYSGSKRKEAAWLFIIWATSRDIALAAQLQGIPSARRSVWRNPSFTSRDPAPEWTEASMRSYEIATYQWNPPVIGVEEARLVIGEAISAAILEKDTAAAAGRAAAELNRIITNEYWEWSQREH